MYEREMIDRAIRQRAASCQDRVKSHRKSSDCRRKIADWEGDRRGVTSARRCRRQPKEFVVLFALVILYFESSLSQRLHRISRSSFAHMKLKLSVNRRRIVVKGND
jgi:hypothetical protein